MSYYSKIEYKAVKKARAEEYVYIESDLDALHARHSLKRGKQQVSRELLFLNVDEKVDVEYMRMLIELVRVPTKLVKVTLKSRGPGYMVELPDRESGFEVVVIYNGALLDGRRMEVSFYNHEC